MEVTGHKKEGKKSWGYAVPVANPQPRPHEPCSQNPGKSFEACAKAQRHQKGSRNMGNKGEVPLVTQSAKGGDEPFPLFKVAKGRKLNGTSVLVPRVSLAGGPRAAQDPPFRMNSTPTDSPSARRQRPTVQVALLDNLLHAEVKGSSVTWLFMHR